MDDEFIDFLLDLKEKNFCDSCLNEIQKVYNEKGNFDFDTILCKKCDKILEEDTLRGIDDVYRESVEKGLCHDCAMAFAESLGKGRLNELVAICENCIDVVLSHMNKKS
jgi:protein-arginine kinase activator protein McsA